MSGGFDSLAAALAREAARIARARVAERRVGEAKWRSSRLLWPRFGTGGA